MVYSLHEEASSITSLKLLAWLRNCISPGCTRRPCAVLILGVWKLWESNPDFLATRKPQDVAVHEWAQVPRVTEKLPETAFQRLTCNSAICLSSVTALHHQGLFHLGCDTCRV